MMEYISSDAISFRRANSRDYERIANLHIESWQNHYRGMCPDDYLDQGIYEDRLKVWSERFSTDNPNQIVILAEDESGQLLGFACTFLKHHSQYGAYLDNLHVDLKCQGKGLGRKLMSVSAEAVRDDSDDETIYLHVLSDNKAAIGFYERIGGELIQEYEDDLPWGERGVIVDYLWKLNQLI